MICDCWPSEIGCAVSRKENFTGQAPVEHPKGLRFNWARRSEKAHRSRGMEESATNPPHRRRINPPH